MLFDYSKCIIRWHGDIRHHGQWTWDNQLTNMFSFLVPIISLHFPLNLHHFQTTIWIWLINNVEPGCFYRFTQRDTQHSKENIYSSIYRISTLYNIYSVQYLLYRISTLQSIEKACGWSQQSCDCKPHLHVSSSGPGLVLGEAARCPQSAGGRAAAAEDKSHYLPPLPLCHN